MTSKLAETPGSSYGMSLLWLDLYVPADILDLSDGQAPTTIIDGRRRIIIVDGL